MNPDEQNNNPVENTVPEVPVEPASDSAMPVDPVASPEDLAASSENPAAPYEEGSTAPAEMDAPMGESVATEESAVGEMPAESTVDTTFTPVTAGEEVPPVEVAGPVDAGDVSGGMGADMPNSADVMPDGVAMDPNGAAAAAPGAMGAAPAKKISTTTMVLIGVVALAVVGVVVTLILINL